MQALVGLGASLFGGTAATGAGAAAGSAFAGATAAGAATATGAAAAGGISLSSILQGATSILGITNAISSGNAQAQQLELAAADSQRQIPTTMLQGIAQRTAIKKQLGDALGAQDVAYAGSGTDLSFGTPAQARKDAFREADNALTTQGGTEQSTIARLDERTKNYLQMAGKAKQSGYFDAATIGLKGLTSFANRG
jgi:hypothetical protein